MHQSYIKTSRIPLRPLEMIYMSDQSERWFLQQPLPLVVNITLTIWIDDAIRASMIISRILYQQMAG